ncbi:MAG: hypothetical protein HY658_04230, partial [Actinobacteria bacterium]|nr:hypothetical protein [Actinomycetota bacterium]
AGTAPGRGGGRVRRALGRFPWEAGLLLLALAALYEILTRGAAPSGGSRGAPPEVDLLVPLFPILFVAGAGGLALRGLRRLLPRLRTAGGRARAGLYLAARRLAAVPRSALLLVMVGALAVGILSYAGVFVASSEATARQKSLVFVGADAAVGVNGPVELPAAVAARATLVVRLPVATTSEGLPVAVLGVDPATFPRAAFFDPGFAGGSLEGLLGRLGPMEGGELPVLVAGAGFPRSTALDLLGRDVPVRVVATAEAFPGMPGSAPLVVASAAGLEEALHSPLRNFQPAFQVWVRGDPEPVVDALLARGVVPQGVLTAAQVREQPAFRSLGWIFGFMQVLGMLVGTVALTATLLYLQSRQRSREMSYALARRMGLARRSHRRSVALELAGMLGVALVVGAGAAAGAALLVHRELDFMPGLPPAAVVRAPWTLLAATVATLAAFTWIGAWAVQRRADRANIAEVMRLAG